MESARKLRCLGCQSLLHQIEVQNPCIGIIDHGSVLNEGMISHPQNHGGFRVVLLRGDVHTDRFSIRVGVCQDDPEVFGAAAGLGKDEGIASLEQKNPRSHQSRAKHCILDKESSSDSIAAICSGVLLPAARISE